MASVVVLGSLPESLLNFRGPLLNELVTRGHRVTACAQEASDSVATRLGDMGVDYRAIPFERAGLNPLTDLRVVAALYRLFRKIRPAAVLAYTIKPVIYGSIAARLAGVPGIFSMITGLGYSFGEGGGGRQKFVGSLARLLYRISLSANRRVFFQNPDDRDLFLDLGVVHDTRKTIITNGSGVDLDAFQPAPLPSDPSFLLIARLLRDKGVVEYAEAARIVKAARPDVSFRLAGWIDENPSAISERQLDAWIGDGTIEFLGKLDDVRAAIAASAVYVLPSYREGTPRTVLEAMAMGRPVITTDVPGCRETVREGYNGFLVPPRDVLSLVQAIEGFLDEPELIPTMGARSRAVAEAKYEVHGVNRVIIHAMGL